MDSPGRPWADRLKARLAALAARTGDSRLVPPAMKSGLQRRLLLLLLAPLGILRCSAFTLTTRPPATSRCKKTGNWRG